jgi:DNA repair photolyase
MKMSNDSEYKHFRPTLRGRGALENPAGRFEKLSTAVDSDAMDALYDPEEAEENARRCTQIFKDKSKTIIATNDSPDIGMEATVNPYRGCEHGCIYCYARPGHEYFGLSAGIDFETKIFAKPEAAKLLEQKFSLPSWEPKVVTLSGVTDCYQPIEKQLKITRGCMEVLRDFRNPAAIITKNHLVTRDIDIFSEMAKYNCIVVNVSVTTLDSKLSRSMEPRASQPHMRLRAIEALAKAGVPVNVMMGPIVPGLTEHEIPSILQKTAEAGAVSAAYTMMRLPYGVKDLFQTWVHQHYPDRAKKILNRIREVRGGNLNDPRFGSRMRGEGFHADQIAHIFKMSKKRYGLDKGFPRLTTKHFRHDGRSTQMNLFH